MNIIIHSFVFQIDHSFQCNYAVQVSKESVALNQELQALEHQSTSNGNFAALVNEAVQLSEQNSFQGMFQGN